MTRSTKNSSTPTLPKLPSTKLSTDIRPGHSKQENPTGVNDDVNICEMFKVLSEKYDDLCAKLDSIITRMDERDCKLERIEKENTILKQKLTKIEERLDDVEMVGRRNNLILSGSEITKLSTNNNIVQAVTELLRHKLSYELSSGAVISAYRLGVKTFNQSPDSRNVLLKLVNYETKIDILSACRSAKPRDLYANDDLTPSKASLLYTVRSVKRMFPSKITACGSYDGRLFIYLRPPDNSARSQRMNINSLSQFDKICEKTIGKSSADLLLNGGGD